MISVEQMLKHVDKARKAWCFDTDPGTGRHAFGRRYVLCIKDNKYGKFDRNYSIEIKNKPGHPITMSHDWESFDKNLRKPPSTKKDSMTKVNDQELRKRICLKCKNDWDLDLTDDEVSMCIIEMEEQRLSIFHSQLWPNVRKTGKYVGNDWVETVKVTWDKTVDGYRTVAHRSGKFAGMEPPVFLLDESGQLIARITVYALDGAGTPRPYTGEARFVEFVQLVPEYENRKKTGKKVPNSKWSGSPYNQISLAAERQALRKAFPELSSDTQESLRDPSPVLEASRGEPTAKGYDSPDLPTLPALATLATAPEASATSTPTAAAVPSLAPAPIQAPAPIDSPKIQPTPEPPVPQLSLSEWEAEWDAECRKLGHKYNGDQIVMVAVQNGGIAWMALDSGYKVRLDARTKEIKETSRKPRTDSFMGGKEWKVGDDYYDGSKVLAISKSQKDEMAIWLTLEGDTKVNLNRWGKELKRKSAEPKDKRRSADTATQTSEVTPAVAGSYDGPATRPDPETIPRHEPATAAPSQEDYRKIGTVEMLRKYATPILKKWCETRGKRMSPREAYLELTGVVIGSEGMAIDDYVALIESLNAAIEEEGIADNG